MRPMNIGTINHSVILKIKNIWQELKEDGSFYKFDTNFLSLVQLSLKIFSYGKKSQVFFFLFSCLQPWKICITQWGTWALFEPDKELLLLLFFGITEKNSS